jgi:hypothetical protein
MHPSVLFEEHPLFVSETTLAYVTHRCYFDEGQRASLPISKVKSNLQVSYWSRFILIEGSGDMAHPKILRDRVV